ncbi:hypothetical protein AB0D59_19590 [Streptomyces sp. NPDC048417]|uniref:hypothetical protein n=1 Tax=Streptomyces sp. NPDC048417 TaxID=3155387 RepID=UPI003439880D
MSASPGIAHGAAPDGRGGRVAIVAAGLVGTPKVLDVLADAGYGVISLPTTSHRTLLRCAVIDAHQYAARGYVVRKVGVRGKTDDGLHRGEWDSLTGALRLPDLTVPEFLVNRLVNADPGPESLEHLRTFLNSASRVPPDPW